MKLQGIVSDQITFQKRILQTAKHTGAWLSMWGNAVTGTVLAATDFRDFLCADYNNNPPNHQNNCYSCMQNFLVRHALSPPLGGLVIARHNEIRDKIIHLAKKAFSPHCVCIKPLIHLVRRRSEEEVCHGGSVP